MEFIFWFCVMDSVSKELCLSKNAGFFGGGRSTISLFSMEVMVDTAGLSFANSCTHNRPICMHRNISTSKHGSDIAGSTKAEMSRSFHNLKA
jgi:hypothetical protein